jgi:glucose-6-phosphate 1-epimerase
MINEINFADIVEIGDELNKVKIHLHGSTIISWKHRNRELIFTSPEAVFDGSKPIRGGIPIVFPRFGPSDLFPKQQHGFARNSKWKLSQSNQSKASFELEWEESTFKPAGKLLYNISLNGSSLRLELKPLIEGDASYHSLFHTYFQIENVGEVSINGLEQCKYYEKSENYANSHEPKPNELNGVKGEIDRLYECKGEITLTDKFHKIKMSSNAKNVVVWNPGKKMADVPEESVKKFICIEHGNVKELGSPQTLWAEYSVTLL